MDQPTKREVLRLFMSVFDPLELIANFTIKGRIISSGYFDVRLRMGWSNGRRAFLNLDSLIEWPQIKCDRSELYKILFSLNTNSIKDWVTHYYSLCVSCLLERGFEWRYPHLLNNGQSKSCSNKTHVDTEDWIASFRHEMPIRKLFEERIRILGDGYKLGHFESHIENRLLMLLLTVNPWGEI